MNQTFSTTKIYQSELTSSFQMKVFSLVWLAMATSAIAVFTAWPVIKAVPLLLNPWFSLIVLLWLIFTAPKWAQIRPLNIILFLVFAYVLWLWITPLIAVAIWVWWLEIVMKAFTATAALTIAAWMYWASTNKDLSWMWWFLMMSLIWLIIVSLLQLIWPSPIAHMVISWISVVLFSAYIAYDINMLKHYPENMAIEAAIWLYLSIFNLFQSVLSLLISLNRE